jgi:hypothetical protein
LTANLLERSYWKNRNILMTLKVHVLGLRSFQKVQKERHSSEMALELALRSSEMALQLALRSSVTAGHHTYRRECHHGRKNLHSEHHSCWKVWKAVCNYLKKRHLQMFQSCQGPCMSVKEILQQMNRMKGRRNLEKVLEEHRNLLMVATDLDASRRRMIQKIC